MPPDRPAATPGKSQTSRATTSQSELISPPRFLYKFRSIVGENRAFVESIFDSNTLYFAEPAELNDPAEGRFRVSLDADPEDLYAHLVDFFEYHRGNQRKHAEILARETIRVGPPGPDIVDDMGKVAVENVRSKARILSLSSRCDDHAMWAVYADSHRGICLKFDTTIAQPSIFSLALPVVYQREIPTFEPYRAWARMQQQDRMESYEAVKPMAFTKGEEWSHEKEWRVVMFDPPKIRSFPPESLVGVVFGARIAHEDESEVRSWISEHAPHVRVYRAALESDTDTVDVIPDKRMQSDQ